MDRGVCVRAALLVLVLLLLPGCSSNVKQQFDDMHFYLVAKNVSTLLFDNVIKQKLNLAPDYVTFDISFEETALPEEGAIEVWSNRLHTLRQNGVYLKSFDDLQISLDGHVPTGQVTLIIVENGKEIVRKDKLIFSRVNEQDYWGINQIVPLDGSRPNELEQYLGGFPIKYEK